MKVLNVFVLGLFLYASTSFSNEHRETVITYLPDLQKNNAQTQGLKPIKFMPGLYIGELTKDEAETLADDNPDSQVDIMPDSKEELETSSAAMLLKTPDNSPSPVSNWWDAGYTGKSAVIGVLDSGVPDDYSTSQGSFSKQSGLKNKNLIVNRGPDSGFEKYLNGVRTAHGTGVACIYANEQSDRPGLAHGIENLLVTLAGDSEVDDTDWELTLNNLDWLLSTEGQIKPTVINYSFGNGQIYCAQGPCLNNDDWSMVARTVDYIVNTYKISWVKSAGNKGWIEPTRHAPFASTLSIPAESYNAIVVANMNTTLVKTLTEVTKTSDRSAHNIMASSSRGPTLEGRRKPDLTAPGNDTRTCAPTESVYSVENNPTFTKYTISSQYDPISETRLVGGTSMATPHVGAATALIYDSGIKEPMAIKALLINSADTWTDANQPGPNDKLFPCTNNLPNCGHGKIEGSQWNRTYGWGYINMDKAFIQRNNVTVNSIKPKQAICYRGSLEPSDKVTLVWERRMGLNEAGEVYALTPLKLEIRNAENASLIAADKSKIDNVLQVSSYPHDIQDALIKVSVRRGFRQIEGAESEPFALVTSGKFQESPCDIERPLNQESISQVGV